MAWTLTRASIRIRVDGSRDCWLIPPDGSTIVVPEELDSGGPFLRMFGINGGAFTDAFSEQLGLDLNGYQRPAPVDVGDIQQGDGQLGYIDSLGEERGYDFLLEYSSSWTFEDAALSPLGATVIPVSKRAQSWAYDQYTYADDGTYTRTTTVDDFDVYYCNANVIRLPDGEGWLMTMSRYRRLTADGGNVVLNRGEAEAIGDVVGYWAPEDDPSFTSSRCKGPFWLVNCMQAVHQDFEGFRTWLGVPGSCVATDPADNERYLYVYYVFESVRTRLYESVYKGQDGYTRLCEIAAETYDPNRLDDSGNPYRFLDSGIGVRRIRLEDFLDHRDDWSANREATWVTRRGGLVPGEVLGPVNVWVGAWSADGSTHLHALQHDAQLAAPEPEVCDDTIHLFLATASYDNQYDASGPRETAYGIRHVVSMETTGDTTFGRDFVVGTATETIVTSAVTYDDVGDGGASLTFYADPDVVQLPDCSWRMYVLPSPVERAAYGRAFGLQYEAESGDVCAEDCAPARPNRVRDPNHLGLDDQVGPRKVEVVSTVRTAPKEVNS